MTGNPASSLSRNDFFLKSLTRKYILSSIFGMISVYAGAFIDTVIVGIFLDEAGLSAMSLVSPVYLLYYTAGSVIGIGGSVTAGVCIGKGDYAGYRRIFTLSFTAAAILAVLTTAAGLIFLDYFTNLLSGGNNSVMVRDYLRFYFAGGGFTLISYIPLYFLKIDGRPQKSTALFAAYASANTVLTFLFMSPVFNMGISGASLATSLSMAFSAVVGMIILLHGGETKFEKNFFSAASLGEVVVNGIPSGLSNLFESLRIIIVNALLINISSVLLPTFTVVRNVTDLLSALTLGIASSLLPLNSVFFAEHDFVSIRAVFRRIMKIGLIVSAAASVLAAAFPEAAAAVFGISDPQVIADVRLALPLACAGTVVSYVNVHFTYYFNTVGRIFLSNTVLFFRTLLCLAATAVPLSISFGAAGIWFSFTAAEIFTFVFCAVILIVIRADSRKKTPLDFYLLRADGAENPEITFSVKNDIGAVMEASNKITNFCKANGISIRKTTMVSLAIEEMLQVIIPKCIPSDGREYYIDIRICKFDDKVLMRIRNSGKIFDPTIYYEQNKTNEKMAGELLGLRMIINAAKVVDFRKTFGINNLTITF